MNAKVAHSRLEPHKAEAPVLSGSERGAATIAQLLDAAEKLFAERGVATVSLREIVLSSGQRNASAAHYHFGNRNALVAAVISRRMTVINATRHQALDELLRNGREGDVRALFEASVGALARHVESSPWGGHFVQIAAQISLHPDIAASAQIDPEAMSSLVRFQRMLRAALPGVPEALLRRRGKLANGFISMSITQWLRHHGEVNAGNSKQFWRQVRLVSDMVAAGMGTPV